MFFTGAALSGFAYVASAHVLVRRVVPARPALALATGLLLGTPYVAALFHYSRMDPLFAATIVAAMACMHSGLRRPSISLWVIAGFDVVAYATYDGVYTYYYGGIVTEIDQPAELAAYLEASDRLIVVMRRSSHTSLGALVADLPVVQEQRIAENLYLMLRQDRTE